jgi:AcrR family transcriptional regulator
MSRIIENPKQLILDHSKNILYREGYSKFSIRTVAKECALGIGTIYNYFPTKKDIIIELMTDYWRENFKILDHTLTSNVSFYVKLEYTFNNIKIFIKNFKDVWLSMSCFSEDHYVVSGLERESIFMEILIRKIEHILIEEVATPDSKVCMKMDSYEIAKFIFQNFIAMAQMPFIEYQSFENILKQLLEYN